MFIVSVRSSQIKSAALCALLAASAVFGVFAAGKSVSSAVRLSESGISYLASTAQERITFLSQFGWEVGEDPIEVSEVIIPAEFDGAYDEYNEMQKEHGLDLSKYAGRRAKRWTYEVLNYPDYEGSGLVQANIFVLDGEVIGGDICSLEKDGFICSFDFPKENYSTDAKATTG